MLFEFKDYSVYYKIKKKKYIIALDSINLSISEGDFTVVLGESGCGKTTLLRSLLGLCDMTDGKLLYNGTEINGKIKDNTFAYVSQEYCLYPQMTVYQNLAFPLRMMKVPVDEMDKRVKEIAEKLQLEWLLTRKPKQLSGGQHQRVAIARALIKNPRIMLFDEPFANVHPDMREELRDLVKQIHSETKPTIVFVTHDVKDAIYLADKIIVMKDGAIIKFGTTKSLQAELMTDYGNLK